MNKEEIYFQYKKNKNKKYNITNAKWDIKYELFNIYHYIKYDKIYMLKELEAKIEDYVNICTNDVIEFVLNYIKEKNNPKGCFLLLL